MDVAAPNGDPGKPGPLDILIALVVVVSGVVLFVQVAVAAQVVAAITMVLTWSSMVLVLEPHLRTRIGHLFVEVPFSWCTQMAFEIHPASRAMRLK